jgi:hypothetical protein
MGIDVHALNLLRFAAARKPFGRVATIGRQGLHVPPEKVRKLLNLNQEIDYGKYCEDLLKAQFGAKSVDSFDNSDYEGATHIVDMNVRLKKQYRYDTVIDGGSLEHIYNAPQALKNLSEMCEEGGQILHMLPANNFCGHGFWQFSPELFFSLYSGKNGYVETQVFLADLSNEYFWYEVSRTEGERANVTSGGPLCNMVRTEKRSFFSHEDIQQSDYLRLWHPTDSMERTRENRSLERRIKQTVGKLPFESLARLAWKRLKNALPAKTALSNRNPCLVRRAVADLIAS